MDNFEEFHDFSGGSHCRHDETARELGSEVQPEDVTELLQSHDKTLTNEECFLQMNKESGFLRWNIHLVKMW